MGKTLSCKGTFLNYVYKKGGGGGSGNVDARYPGSSYNVNVYIFFKANTKKMSKVLYV